MTYPGEKAVVRGMALVRFISASIEFTAAMLILRLGRVEPALRINAVLGLIGPTILVLVTGLGIVGLAGKVSPGKLSLIFFGVLLILAGTVR